jgi:hypothetical protein
MLITLTLDPNSLNNEKAANYIMSMLADIPDLQVNVIGDIYFPGTWQTSFGDPAAMEGARYSGCINDPGAGVGPGGTAQYSWNVNNHIVS